MKKIIAFFMLFVLFVKPVVAQEPSETFTAIFKDEIAPFDGYLFTPEALAKIYSDIEQEDKNKQLQYDTKLKALNLEITRLNNVHKIELDNKDLLLQKTTTEKNKIISELSGKIELQKWFIAGAFTAGIFLTGTAVYYITMVTR